MSTDEMFESKVRSAGDLAGVFENDGETSYFYLYDLEKTEAKRVIGAQRVAVDASTFDQEDVLVTWNDDESAVGLFLKGTLWAAFDAKSHEKFGGSLDANGRTCVPDDVWKTAG